MEIETQKDNRRYRDNEYGFGQRKL